MLLGTGSRNNCLDIFAKVLSDKDMIRDTKHPTYLDLFLGVFGHFSLMQNLKIDSSTFLMKLGEVRSVVLQGYLI